MTNSGCKVCNQKQYELRGKKTIAQGKIELRRCTNCSHQYRIKIDMTGAETYFC